MRPDQRDVSRNTLDVWEPQRQVSMEPYVFVSLFKPAIDTSQCECTGADK